MAQGKPQGRSYRLELFHGRSHRPDQHDRCLSTGTVLRRSWPTRPADPRRLRPTPPIVGPAWGCWPRKANLRTKMRARQPNLSAERVGAGLESLDNPRTAPPVCRSGAGLLAPKGKSADQNARHATKSVSRTVGGGLESLESPPIASAAPRGTGPGRKIQVLPGDRPLS